MKQLSVKVCLIFTLAFVMQASSLFAQTLAFPGALGFGRYVTGGRGGTVYHVTNLNNSGAGSFRDAVGTSNRIVVFDVAGYITLTTAVSVKSNITIAGQTAPAGGIGFRGGEISFANSSNIICRYIRIRPGSETASTTDDALSFYRAKKIILDHCSLEFAPWNNIDGVSDDWQNYPVDSITVQHCIIADPTGQQFGAHTESVNSTWAWFYNIFANSHNRNPLAKINTIFVNNVLYNCSAGYTTHTSTNFKHDIVNNYFIFGPASTGTDNTWYQVDKNQSIYYSGNLKDTDLNGTLNGAATTPYWYQGPGTILTSPWSTLTTTVTPYTTATAYRYSVSRSGALPIDQVDALVLSQVKTLGSGTTGTGAGTRGPGGALYTSQTETGLGNNGYGTITTGTQGTDTDGDGMPNYWELANGLNINSNDALVLGADGYRNIEKYINYMADPHVSTVTGVTVDVDLVKYAGGFTSVSPTYTVSSATNGQVSLVSGHIARFVPAANFTGMGKFNFSVSGSDGASYSGQVKVAMATVANNQTVLSTSELGSTSITADRAEVVTKAATIQVYPNPASGSVNIKLAGFANKQLTISVFGIDGKLLQQQSVQAATDNYKLKLAKAIVAGQYILEVTDGAAKTSATVLVK